MKKTRRCFVFFLIFIMCFKLISINVSANSQTEEQTKIAKYYKKSGYTNDQEAIEKFKNSYNQDPNINNIKKYIPFEISLIKGSFDKNQERLDLEYLNTKSKALFKVMVFPIEKEIPLGSSEIRSTMEDGTPYSYQKDDGFYIFRFNAGKFSYVLSSNFLGENQNIDKEVFFEIVKEIKN